MRGICRRVICDERCLLLRRVHQALTCEMRILSLHSLKVNFRFITLHKLLIFVTFLGDIEKNLFAFFGRSFEEFIRYF